MVLCIKITLLCIKMMVLHAGVRSMVLCIRVLAVYAYELDLAFRPIKAVFILCSPVFFRR